MTQSSLRKYSFAGYRQLEMFSSFIVFQFTSNVPMQRSPVDWVLELSNLVSLRHSQGTNSEGQGWEMGLSSFDVLLSYLFRKSSVQFFVCRLNVNHVTAC